MSDLAPEKLGPDRTRWATLRSAPGSCQHPTEDDEAGYREQQVPPGSVRDRSPDEVAKGGRTVDGDQHGESKPTWMPTGAWSVPGVVARHGDKVLGSRRSRRSRTGAAPALGVPALVPRSPRQVRNHLAILGATHRESLPTRWTTVDDNPWSTQWSRTVLDHPGPRGGGSGIRETPWSGAGLRATVWVTGGTWHGVFRWPQRVS